MRHRVNTRKFGRTSAHRVSMFRNMVSSLLEHEKLETTHEKARLVGQLAERMITLGKRGDLHARRIAASELKQDAAVAKLFSTLGPRYKARQGGYSRVLKAGFRYGDMAPMAIIELVDRDAAAKGAGDKARVAAEEAAAAE